MVFTQEKKPEPMITTISSEVTMEEDALKEKLNKTVEKNGLVEGDRFIAGAEKGKKCADTEDDTLFDSLMEKVGLNGKFQKRFDILYNFILVICVSMPYLNIILALTVPNHWCYVPGRELSNLTVDEWKEKYIPVDPKKQDNGYSSCQMYLVSEDDPQNKSVVDCQFGWEYDRQWYSETTPSQEDWVCDKEMYVSNAFAASRIGEIIGTILFGQLGDQFGRKPVFYITIGITIVGRILTAFTSHLYYLFLFIMCIGSAPSIAVFQSPLVISMEVSDASTRSFVAYLQCVGWVIGLCALPMLAWVVKDWRWIVTLSTLPCVPFFFMYRLLPESPRWLASKGKVKEAVKVLKYISKINGTTFPEDGQEILQNIGNKKEKFYGIPTLFLHWRLAKNTLIIIFCWGISGLCYYILVLNVTTMSGNPFMNFFWQSLVELPGYTCGNVLSNIFGRRWTQAGAYMGASIFGVILIFVRQLQVSYLETLFVSLMKLCLTTSFYMVWLQAIEIYPTCVRQTGTSLGGTISSLMGIFGPYIVLLGTTVHASIPYGVILGCAISACIAASFLPETYNEKLPETLEDAQNFGKEQKFWTFKIYRKK